VLAATKEELAAANEDDGEVDEELMAALEVRGGARRRPRRFRG
jgi:hypothetical protein